MSLIYGTTLATDLFRISYQGIEAAYDQTTPLTLSERISQTMKRHIALMDICLTATQYLFAHDRFKEWIIPLHLISIGNGISRLLVDNNPARDDIGLNIFLNMLSIACVTTRILEPQKYLAAELIAASVRIANIASMRMAIISRMTDLYHQIDFQRIKDVTSQGINYLGRTALVSLTIYACYIRGMMDLQQATRLSTTMLHEIFNWTVLGTALASLIGVTVHLTFKRMGMPPNRNLITLEVAIACLSSAMLLSLSVVGLGRVSSLIELIKPIYPAVCTLVLGSLLWKVLRIAIHEILDQMGVQKGTTRTLGECAMTAIGTIPLTTLTSVGIGFSKTIPGSLALMAKISVVGLIAIPALCCSAVLCGRTLLLGIPSVDEMVTWYDSLNKAPAAILNELFG